MKTIVCISDLQVPYHDVEAVQAIARFIKAYQPDTVVSCGDEMDMQTISKWSKGTELEFERSMGHDRDLTKQVLYDLTVEHMVRSNHTDRLFNTVAMRAPGLLGLPELQLENFLGLKENYSFNEIINNEKSFLDVLDSSNEYDKRKNY